ncbi:MAG: glycoside hydrolase family 16 protein [Acidobacteriota bacterium]|nr:glycoside hydrolase family 16 protein [Acidobacteriota bacterium]
MMTNVEPPSSSSSLRPASAGAACCAWLLLLCASASAQIVPSAATTTSAAPAHWQLAWSDEFNGPDGAPPDAAHWVFDQGGGGWGNQELESYTRRTQNAEQRGGYLVLTARKEEFTGSDGRAMHYTSARLRTQGLFAQTFGRVEARMQLPLGKGIWPAFWMLGSNIGQVNWPASGEIDIMENIGDAHTVYSTIHGPGYSGAKGISAPFHLPADQRVDSGFHVYAVEWAPNDLRFFLDDHLIVERTPADLPAGATWVYNRPFFLILNVAVGGGWPGNPDQTTRFPQQMRIDYVRVYNRVP